jgi:DNA-binding transcriptional MerR regulator
MEIQWSYESLRSGAFQRPDRHIGKALSLSEYRLGELASLSGVSPRNIRAYRERGLLDPPRREGRSAIYDDVHLSQLHTINDLLRRGFNSAHIAEFFTSIRNGHDLADLLGLQDALFRGRREKAAPAVSAAPDADSRRLSELGMAEFVDGELKFTNPAVAEIVGRAPVPAEYVRVMLRAADAVEGIDQLAAAKVRALQSSLLARLGPNYVPEPDEMDRLNRVIADYRDLIDHVVDDMLDAATERHLVTAVSDYTASVIDHGYKPKAQ